MPVNRRDFLFTSSAAFAALATPFSFARAQTWPDYENAILIDGLGSPGGMNTDWDTPLTTAELDDIRQSGMTCTHITVGSVGTRAPLEAFSDIVEWIAFWDKQIDTYPDVLSRVRTVRDIREAKQSGQLGLLYGLQDGVSFQTDLNRLRVLHQLGIRVIQPTYNRRNLLGDGCMEPADAGLSRVGHEAIERMNDAGILLDLSHCGRRTAADAIAASQYPVAFTHTGCDALQTHPRHRTDEEMRAVAQGGGVVGIYVMPYLTGGRQPAAADVIAHLEHAIDVAGEDHVAIGTDGGLSPTQLTEEYRKKFAENISERRELGIAAPGETETGYLFAADLNTPRRFETLADLLLAQGHSDARVEKILGANLLRLFGEVWK